MTDQEKAAEIFNSGFNCSQAVLSTFAPRLGMPREQAMKTASAFGAGIARSQGTCGAVTGALMVLGLAYFSEDDPAGSKTACYEAGQKFLKVFEQENGSVCCRDLLGTTLEEAADKDLFRTVCADMVRSAAALLEDFLP
jgi:C_GCAxxG_C_C family probable redox protein